MVPRRAHAPLTRFLTRIPIAALFFAFVLPYAVAVADDARPLDAAGNGSEGGSGDGAPAEVAAGTTDGPLVGIWEGADRFVEFTKDGRMRIVLKPYYGFVYQDTGYVPCDVEYPARADGRCHVTPRYPRERSLAPLPLLVLGDSLYLSFLARADFVTPAIDADSASPAEPAKPVDAASATEAPTDGLWLAAGAAIPILLYAPERADELYAWAFRGSSYWKIRYWKTDARYRDKMAVYAVPGGDDLSVPKFLTVGGELYTCVTGTGTKLRNIESGTFSVKEGKASFAPDRPVYKGTEARYRDAVSLALSGDRQTLSVGEPWLTRSSIVDLDAAVAEHNAKRRPARKPIFEFMELDFHWEEIERIRRNGR